MRFKVNQLGPITGGKLEFGKLTVVTGGNNTGKTYLAYVVYYYHHYFSQMRFYRTSLGQNTVFVSDTKENQLFETGKTTIDMDPEKIANECHKSLKRIMVRFNRELPRAFSSNREHFTDKPLEIEIDKKVIQKDVADKIRRLRIEPVQIGRIELSCEGDVLTLRMVEQESWRKATNGTPTRAYDANECFHHHFIAPPRLNPFILTSERTGISLFYRDLDENRNALVEALQQVDGKKTPRLPYSLFSKLSSRYALPISKEIDFVRGLEDITKNKSPLCATNAKPLYQLVEAMMQAEYKTGKTGVRYVSKANNPHDFNIPLHMASASAKELLSLYFYLKHVAGKGDLLIFDEPESHMTPDNQVRLARIICECVGAGVDILLTTHSEIMIKEFNNMVMLHELRQERKKVDREFKQYKGYAGIDRKDVKSYSCQDGKIVACEINEWGMRIPQVDDTLSALNEVAVFLSNRVLENNRDLL